MCSKLTHIAVISIVEFEQVNAGWVRFGLNILAVLKIPIHT